MWLTAFTLCILIISLWITWRKRQFSFFQKRNIPGPPPSILFGNYWEILNEPRWNLTMVFHGKFYVATMEFDDGFPWQILWRDKANFHLNAEGWGQHNCIKRWIKEYGRVFGYYFGLRPVLIVADLDLLKTIQLKEFHKFANRPRLFEVGSSSRKYDEYAITTLEGKRWKDIRSVITPTFTISKLKMLCYIVDGAVDELLEAVQNEVSKGKAFDIYPLYQNLTMDVIARTALGLHSTAQKGTNDVFVKLARIIFSGLSSYLALLAFSFTEIIPVFAFIRNLRYLIKNKGKHPRLEMQEKVLAEIQARRNDPNTRRHDVLQLMIDAQATEENANENNLTAGENDEVISTGSAKLTQKVNGKSLTDLEVEHNAVIFLLAGYETTSTALAFLTHCLAYHQDVQEKVREEINENIPNEENVTYDAVNNLQYLEKVINEALRMYPPIIYFVNRRTTEDCNIGEVFIPKNTAIQVPVYYLHHDPTIWKNPEIFDPERFSPEEKRNRHPMAFQPFGAGPRNCVGMRFAQMEIKLAISKLIKKYKILPKKGCSKEDFECDHTIVTLRPRNGIMVELEEI